MTVHINNPSATISASTTSANVAYPVVSEYVRVLNDAAAVAYLRSGSSSVTASAGNGQFLHGNKTTIFKRDRNDTHIAAILTIGTGTIYISPVDADELVGF